MTPPKKTYEKHGMHKTPEYRAWGSMIDRCHNENSTSYDRYGARGIYVCDEWIKSFKSFFDSVGPRPTPKHSIDRINNELGYVYGNCRWATVEVQISNRRNTRKINGMTLRKAAEKYGIPLSRLQDRIRRGLPKEKVLAKGILNNWMTNT